MSIIAEWFCDRIACGLKHARQQQRTTGRCRAAASSAAGRSGDSSSSSSSSSLDESDSDAEPLPKRKPVDARANEGAAHGASRCTRSASDACGGAVAEASSSSAFRSGTVAPGGAAAASAALLPFPPLDAPTTWETPLESSRAGAVGAAVPPRPLQLLQQIEGMVYQRWHERAASDPAWLGTTPLSRDRTLLLGGEAFDEDSTAAVSAVPKSLAEQHHMEQFTAEAAVASRSSAQQRMLEREFAALLDDAVRGHLEGVAHQRVTLVHAAVAAMLFEDVAAAAKRRCRPARGVLRAIAKRTPHVVPMQLDEADEAALAQLLHTGADSDVVIPAGGMNIRRYQLRSCAGTEWLNDQVINYYLKLIEQAAPGVLTLGTHFFSKLASGDREGARRWTRKIDIFSPRVVLVVINQGSHWTLAVVHNERRRLEYYDSLGGAGESRLALLAEFLEDELAQKKKKEKKEEEGECTFGGAHPATGRTFGSWPRCSLGKAVPQQQNGYDCGVFACQFALYVAQGVPFNFNQVDVPFLRKLMILELLRGTILQRI